MSTVAKKHVFVPVVVDRKQPSTIVDGLRYGPGQEELASKIKKNKLLQMGLPVRITTSGGRYFYRNRSALSFFNGPRISIFDTLAEAVDYAIRDIEKANRGSLQ